MEGMSHDTVVAALAPGTIRHPTHGAFKGHLLPGCFFLIWGTYWLVSVYRVHLQSTDKKPYKTRAWYPFPWPKQLPLEPLLKVVFPFIGINGELWAGHDHYRSAACTPSVESATFQLLNARSHATMLPPCTSVSLKSILGLT